MTSRAQRFLQSIRKEIPDAVERRGDLFDRARHAGRLECPRDDTDQAPAMTA
jgi:hypothetical protein